MIDSPIKERFSTYPIEIETLENWNYDSNKFQKEDLTYVINYISNNDVKKKHLLTIKTEINKISKTLLKENISYDFFFSIINNNLSGNKKLIGERITKKYTAENIEGFYKFTGNIISDIMNKKIQIYDLSNRILSIKNNESVLFRIPKTVNYNTDSTNIIITNSEYKINDIIGYRFTEDWYFDDYQFKLIKEVKSLSFYVNEYNNIGEIIESPKLLPFKIKFND